MRDEELDGEELDGALRALLQDEAEGSGEDSGESHPPVADLVAFREGELAEDRVARIQEHLVRCRDCTDLLLAQANLLRSEEEAPGASPKSLAAGVEGVMDRVQREEAAVEPAVALSPAATAPAASSLEAGRPWLAAAALLLACFGLGSWALSLQLENQRLLSEAARAEGELGEATARIAVLETEAGGRVEELSREAENLRAALAQRATPQVGLLQVALPHVNVPILDLFPRAYLRSSGEGPPRLELPREADLFTLILNPSGSLNPSGAPSPGSFRLEIRDDAGRTAWSGTGLRPGEAGNFVVVLSREFLAPGTYQLLLFAAGGEAEEGPRESFPFELAAGDASPR